MTMPAEGIPQEITIRPGITEVLEMHQWEQAVTEAILKSNVPTYDLDPTTSYTVQPAAGQKPLTARLMGRGASISFGSEHTLGSIISFDQRSVTSSEPFRASKFQSVVIESGLQLMFDTIELARLDPEEEQLGLEDNRFWRLAIPIKRPLNTIDVIEKSGETVVRSWIAGQVVKPSS